MAIKNAKEFLFYRKNNNYYHIFSCILQGYPLLKLQTKILILRGNFNFHIALFVGIASCGHRVAQMLFLKAIHSTYLAYHRLPTTSN